MRDPAEEARIKQARIFMRKLLCVFLLWFWSAPCFGQEIPASALRNIIDAGGSVILDMDKNVYSAAELISLARALKYNATLTIRLGSERRFSVPECLQIAKSNPGHVVFWLK